MEDAIQPKLPDSAEQTPRSNRSAMMIVFLVVFIDLLGFGIILPLLPRIAESHVAMALPGPAWRVGLIIGLLMSSFSLMQFAFAPLWGRASDRVGRRPILLIGLLGSVIFYSLFGVAASLPHDTSSTATLALLLFFVARIGAGVAGATISTAQAVIADSTPPEKRKHGMALIGAAFGIGFTFGPLIGYACLQLSGVYPAIGEGVIGYSAAALSLLALLLGVWLLPETRIPAAESTARRNWLDLSALSRASNDPRISPVILTFFIASLGFGAFEVTLALFLKDNFAYGEDHSFLIFAYIGFVLMLTQGYFYRKLANRLSEVTLMGIGIFFMAIGVALLGGISYYVAIPQRADELPRIAAGTFGLLASPFDDARLLAVAGLFGHKAPTTALTAALFIALTASVVGFAFLTPSAQALISRRTANDRQGEILGVNQSASAMARILGPILGVTLYKATDTHLWPYAAGAVLLLLMFPMLPRIKRGDTE